MTRPSVVLRPFRADDVDDLAARANEKDVARGVRDRFPHPYTRADAIGWIGGNLDVEPARNLVIEVDGRFAGGVGIVPKDDVYRLTAEIGYWVAKPYWGKGIATEAVRHLSVHAFARFPFQRLEAGVFDWNTASAKVLEKNGYHFEGTLRRAAIKEGRMCDILMYAKLREE